MVKRISKSRRYTQEFKNELFTELEKEYPELKQIEQPLNTPLKDMKFNPIRDHLYDEIEHDRFKIEGKDVLFYNDNRGKRLEVPGRMPLKNMPYVEYQWERLPEQEVVDFQEYTGRVYLMSARGRKYPSKVADNVETEGVSFALECGYKVMASVVPEDHFVVVHFEIIEKEDVKPKFEGKTAILG